METMSNITVAARNSVFGDSAATATQPGSEPSPANAARESTKGASDGFGNIPEHAPPQPGIEPPAGGPPGEGTIDAPFDRGNEPEQTQSTSSLAAKAAAKNPVSPNPAPGSTMDNPDLSSTSDIKSALTSNDATNGLSKAASTTSSGTGSKANEAGTAKAGSHSALFGLGPKDEIGNSAIHAPKAPMEVSETIDEVGEVTAERAETGRGAEMEEDTGGYDGLKKAAMEEEQKRKNVGTAAGDNGWAASTSASASAPPNQEDDRDPSTFFVSKASCNIAIH